MLCTIADTDNRIADPSTRLQRPSVWAAVSPMIGCVVSAATPAGGRCVNTFITGRTMHSPITRTNNSTVPATAHPLDMPHLPRHPDIAHARLEYNPASIDQVLQIARHQRFAGDARSSPDFNQCWRNAAVITLILHDKAVHCLQPFLVSGFHGDLQRSSAGPKPSAFQPLRPHSRIPSRFQAQPLQPPPRLPPHGSGVPGA